MAIALTLLRREPVLFRAQKLVQARVFAQGATVAMLMATAAFEIGGAGMGKGKYEKVMILDPDDPAHKHIIEKRLHYEAYPGQDRWKDMIRDEKEPKRNGK